MMQHNAIQKQLDELAALYGKQEKLAADKATALDKALTKPVREKIKGVNHDFAGKEENLAMQVRKLVAEIKLAVLALGQTVQGNDLYAVWNKGIVTWDDDKLVGYCKSHEELLEYRKAGKPSVKIRRAPGGKKDSNGSSDADEGVEDEQ